MNNKDYLENQIRLLKLSKKLPMANLLSKVAEYTKSESVSQSAYGIKHQIVLQWLKKHFDVPLLLKQAKEFANTRVNTAQNQIWIFWWQGLDNAPKIVQTCVRSTIQNSGTANVNIIDQNNIEKFIHIPLSVMKKVKSGTFSFTLFSDIVRMGLLSQYGGLWIDATVFTSQVIPPNIFDQQFWSIKSINQNDVWYARHVGKKQWTTYIVGGSNRFPLYYFCYQFLIQYVENYNYFIDYFLTDYVFQLFFEVPINNQILNNLSPSNPAKDVLFDKLNQPMSPDVTQLLEDQTTYFYKLSYKSALIQELNGIPTVYSFLNQRIDRKEI